VDRIQPGGSFPFLGRPLDKLFNTHVDLRELWGARAEVLRTQVCSAKTPTDRFSIVEEALTSALRRQPKCHDAVGPALEALDAEPPHPHIADVAQRAGLSHRRFIEVFTAEVGMTPKLFSRVRRFRRTIDRVRLAGSLDWARLSLACGYCDQSHLIRDFLTFSGLSPSEYAQRRRIAVKDDHVALVG
jgi:AraC-like DNA-binding protein